MNRALVISAFPGCGKTTYYKQNELKYKKDRLVILDSDSSLFSWIYRDGEKTDERNPEFPNNYIQHIKENLDTADIIFVSSHDSVRTALKKAGIKFVVMYPNMHLKEKWITRFKRRGDTDSFIQMISDNWFDLINGMIDDKNTPFKYELLFTTVIDDDVIDTLRRVAKKRNIIE